MTHALALFLVFGPSAGSIARADDWPQWLGPQRDGVWREGGLLTAFPRDGLKFLWRVPVGGGYAGPVVAGGRAYVSDYVPAPAAQRPKDPFQRITQPGQERVHCVDVATGKVLWTDAYDVAYSMSYSAGPRATPVVDGDRLYTLGGEGDLRCMECATGKVIWSKHLSDEQSHTPMWGFASHPMVEGDLLICLGGGSDPEHGRGVVTAYNKLTGEVVWTALKSKEPGYAPPIVVQAGGVRQLIVWDPEALYSLDPMTGKEHWSVPFGPARMGLSVITPHFYHDDQLGSMIFIATQYEGSMVVKLDDAKPEASVLWQRAGKSDRKTDALHTLLSPVAARDAHVYGIDAYGELRCLDLKTGDRLWATYDATTYQVGPLKWAAAFILPMGQSGDRYLIANEHGDLILAQLDPSGYHELSRTHVLDPTNTDPGRAVLWSCPALANRCIYWRNDKELICASMADP